MRFVTLLALAACSTEPLPPVSAPAPAKIPDASPDAGEGARARREEGRVSANSLKAQGVGGLIGTKGVAVGAGGLGSRGTGVGAGGLGGLGTTGIGSGKSGYGKGGGSFGSMGSRMVVQRGGTHVDHGVNKTVITADDRLSTFSIDVDTASFAIARGALDRGSLPPPAAVRVEEFVNAQTYTYPAPGEGEGPFAVSMEAAPHPWEGGHHLLRVGVKAAEPAIERSPVHLTFLVDVSGSMSATDKLPLAKRALTELVHNLDREDRVALVTYAGHTSVVLEPTRMADRDAVLAAIERLGTGGGTAMDSGMQLAYDLAMKTYEPGTENRVVVLSDGDANIGPTSHEEILKRLKTYAEKGITLSTVGFGRSSNDALMEQLANKGDGNYHHIDGHAEARRVFGVHLAGTLRTVARDVKIQVDFDPQSVLSYRLIGYENRAIADRDFRNDKVDAGEIGSGHAVTALYDVILADTPGDTLATVRMRSKLPGPDAPATERTTLLPSAAIQPSFAKSTPDFRVAAATAGFAEKLRHAPAAAELTYASLATIVREAHRPGDAGLLVMIDKARHLSERQAVR